MANVANGDSARRAKLLPMRSERREAWQPWYGASMRAQPQPEEFNGDPVRRRARPASRQDDGLYRYVPVPPAHYDADGYLVEDGMSQSLQHHSQTAHWREALARRLPAATVCADLTIHYRKGDRDRAIVPDLFVALRAPPREERTSYKLWQYPVPDLVAEMLSKKTSEKDVCSKRNTYAHLGVTEYWLFDPKGFQLPTPLVGYRLRAGRYVPIAADTAGRRRSRVLGLDLHVRAGELRFRDPATGEDLRTLDESERRGAAAEQGRAAAERERAAEKHRADRAEVERDAAERGRMAEKVRADAAEDERDVAERRRLAEKHRADAAERELARLRLHLEGA